MGLRRRALILAKEEATYGTDAVPTVAANSLLAFNPTLNPVGAKVSRNPVRDTISGSPGLMGSRYCEMAFETEFYGSGAAGTAARYGDLLEACSMTETVSPGVSVTYKPNSLGTGGKSVTIYANFDGRLHKLTGCIGTFEMILQAGQPARIRWTFRGIYNAPTDTALAAPTLEANVNAPPKVLGSAFTFNSIATLVVQQLSINLGNVLANREDVNATHGYKGFAVTGRQATATINPETFAVGTYDLFTDWLNATLRQLSVVVGATAGSIMTVTLPKCEVDDVRQGDRDGIETWEIPLSLAYNTGDDEVQIVFT